MADPQLLLLSCAVREVGRRSRCGVQQSKRDVMCVGKNTGLFRRSKKSTDCENAKSMLGDKRASLIFNRGGKCVGIL